MTGLAGSRAQDETRACLQSLPPAQGSACLASRPQAPATTLTCHLQPHSEPPSLVQDLPAGVVALILQPQCLDVQRTGICQREAWLSRREAGIGGQEEDRLRVIPVPGYWAPWSRDVATVQSNVLVNLSNDQSLQPCTRKVRLLLHLFISEHPPLCTVPLH